MVRVLVIDDEPLSREAIAKLLAQYCSQHIEVVGLAASAEQARAAVLEYAPDAIFLDVEMPYENGFDFLHSMPERNFNVVFVATHESFAISAIREGAVDYLLKPINLDELRNAAVKLAELKHRQEYPHDHYRKRMKLLLEYVHGTGGSAKLAVPNNDGVTMVDVPRILYCKAQDNYTNLKLLGANDILSTRHLKEYEEVLTDVGFARVHKSYLVNITHVRQFHRNEYGGGILVLADNTSIEVSRRRKTDLMELLQRHGNLPLQKRKN
ncbi:MAG: response regulator transcription factor [Candidatus Kapabacteria bacterium]|nr:response regulator transcription factor [Candidatus Kapabacteria bacterium]